MSALRIERARLRPIRLELAQPLATAHGAIGAREGCLIELRDASGGAGWGEALPLPAFGGEDLPACTRAIERGLRALLEARASALPELLDCASAAVDAKRNLVAANALELALLDLAARARGTSLADLLGFTPRARIPVSALVAGENPEALTRAARAAHVEGFRCLKLKLGGRTLAEDLARVAALRAAVGAGLALRLDANGAWGEGEALEAVAALARFEIELLEQPVAAAELDALERICRAAPFPIGADESLALPGASDRLLEQRAVGALVLKLPVLGGPRAALALARRARRAGIGCLATSFLDSSLGVHAAAQLAAALGANQRPAGLATSGLLRRDLAPAPRFWRGELCLPGTPGIGVEPDVEALAQLGCGPALEFAR